MTQLVSIVVPIYNMGDSIETCVRSIMEQDYPHIEIILVDDGSKDDSLAICQKLAQADSRIKVFHTENCGSGPARNYGIEAASGEYVYFPDADDYMEPYAVTEMLKSITATDADMLIFGFKSVGADGKTAYEKKYANATVSGEEIRSHYAKYKAGASHLRMRGAPWNKLFRRQVILDHRVEFPPLRRHQDEAFIARFLSYAQSVAYCDAVLYIHYENDQKLEWKKYPVDYIEAVSGLYAERKTNVLTWNPDDGDTKNMAVQEYICNTIKALELSFSPKFQFTAKQRKAWMKERLLGGELLTCPVPDTLGRYQRVALGLARRGRIGLLYTLLGTKAFAFKILGK